MSGTGAPKNGAGRSSGVPMEIVLPGKPNVSERLAADELKYHFSKATGSRFAIVTENAPKSELRRFYIGRAAVCGGVDSVGTGPFGMKILVGLRLFFEIEWGDFTP